MNKEKQIIEIKECIDAVYGADCAYFDVDGFAIANEIYNAGYRKQEWISVEERLPEDNGDELIVCTEDGFVGAARFTAVIEEGFCWMENEGSDFYDGDLIEGVTHWMPLPEPPKMKGGAE